MNHLDESYSIWNIQDYFEYIIKKAEKLIDNPQIKLYINKTENRITFEIKKSISQKYNLSQKNPVKMKPTNTT